MTAATVLLVEDESVLLEVFARWFERAGYRVCTAGDGVEALAVVRRETVDLVVTDIRMPNMDGIELVGRLPGAAKAVPKVMFVSGNAEITLRALYDLGVEAFFSKPIDRSDLMAAARTCLTERAVLWAAVPAVVPDQSLRARYDGVSAARDAGRLAFGHGGFCVAVEPHRFSPQAPIGLDLRFEHEGRGLVGQGIVRWVDPTGTPIGVEIVHVSDAARAWVLEVTAASGGRAFIPKDLTR